MEHRYFVMREDGKATHTCVDLFGDIVPSAWEEVDEEAFSAARAEVEERSRAEEEIERLKKRLSDTDYKAIKYAEGLITDEDYETTRKLRQSMREQINELEKGMM